MKPAVCSFLEFIDKTPIAKIFSDKKFQNVVYQFITNPKYRSERIIANTSLKGIENAYQLGLITQEERGQAWDLFQTNGKDPKIAGTYLFLQSCYLTTGAIINSISLPVIASSVVAENPFARFSLGLFIDVIVPMIVRSAMTASVGVITHQDLKAATIASSIPKLGSYIAIPADIAHKFGKQSEPIWHYTKRGIIASLSKILRPWGGWNTDFEEKLWNSLNAERW